MGKEQKALDNIMMDPRMQRIIADENGHEAVARVAQDSIRRRRQVVVFEIARQIHALLQARGLATGHSITPQGADDSQWYKVESLSQLRAVVGGRFKNLKERWVEAGFPLREHRGDREGKASVDKEGWAQLGLWINKQGFQVRLADDSEPWLFEVRKSAVES